MNWKVWGQKVKNKKIYIILILLAVVFVCAFTFDSENYPEESDYIMSLFFDVGEEGIKTVYESPVLKKDEAQAVLYGEQRVSEFNILHFQDFANEYMNSVARKPDFQHLKILLIGEELLKNEEKFAEFIAFLHEQNEFAENVFVAIDKSNGEILKDENECAGKSLENLFSERSGENEQMNVTVGKLLAACYNENQAVYIPVVSEDKKIQGEWVVACKKAVSYVDEDMAKWLLAANCMNCGQELYFQDVYEEALNEEDNFSIEISKIKRQISFKESGNKVNAYILLTLKGKVRSYCGELITDAADRINKEQLFSVCLSDKFERFASYSKGKDLFNTYYELSNKNRSIWKKYQNRYEEYVKNLNVDVTVEIDFTD